jgi:superoxide reductase
MLSEFVKTADWKNEKHVPVIICADTVSAGTPLEVTVTVGKEIAHPNTMGHHIAWIALHFVPAGMQRSIVLGRCEFSAHGATADENGIAFTDSTFSLRVRLATAGTLYATAYCNLHGLWASEKELIINN